MTNLDEDRILFDIAELHISPSQKQKCFVLSRIFISRQPLAVFTPIAFAFINSSLVKHLREAGSSKIIKIIF